MGIFSNAHTADDQQATTTVTTVTLLDDDGDMVKIRVFGHHLAVQDWPFVGYQGDMLLVQSPGPQTGWANRPLKPNQRAVWVVPLSDVAKIVFTDPT